MRKSNCVHSWLPAHDRLWHPYSFNPEGMECELCGERREQPVISELTLDRCKGRALEIGIRPELCYLVPRSTGREQRLRGMQLNRSQLYGDWTELEKDQIAPEFTWVYSGLHYSATRNIPEPGREYRWFDWIREIVNVPQGIDELDRDRLREDRARFGWSNRAQRHIFEELGVDAYEMLVIFGEPGDDPVMGRRILAWYNTLPWWVHWIYSVDALKRKWAEERVNYE